MTQMPDTVIVVDGREPKTGGWEPFFKTRTIRGPLDVGDFSLAGAESLIAIERKTAPDLAACLTWERGRFCRELDRSRGLDFFRVIVECDAVDLLRGGYGKHENRANPAALWESMAALSVRYNTAFLFASNAATAATLCESLLCKWLREHCKILESVRRSAQDIRDGTAHENA